MHKIRVPWLSFVFCTLLCLGYGIQAASQREEVHSGREQSRTEELGICDKCSIYILDLSELGGQPCSLEKNVAVNANNGVVYLPEHGPVDKVSHKFGTHSAPYYLYEVSFSLISYTSNRNRCSWSSGLISRIEARPRSNSLFRTRAITCHTHQKLGCCISRLDQQGLAFQNNKSVCLGIWILELFQCMTGQLCYGSTAQDKNK